MRSLIGVLLLGFALAACGDEVQEAAPDLSIADATMVVDAAGCTLLKAYSSSDKPCNDCAQTTCCLEVNACYAATTCDDDYTNCYLACALLPDPDAGAGSIGTCLADCRTQYPEGGALFDAAIGCVEQRCAAECQ